MKGSRAVSAWGGDAERAGEASAGSSPGQVFRRQRDGVSWSKGLLFISFIGPACPIRENIQLLEEVSKEQPRSRSRLGKPALWTHTLGARACCSGPISTNEKLSAPGACSWGGLHGVCVGGGGSARWQILGALAGAARETQGAWHGLHLCCVFISCMWLMNREETWVWQPTHLDATWDASAGSVPAGPCSSNPNSDSQERNLMLERVP